MANKNHLLKWTLIVGVNAVLLLFIFILVAHHRANAERVRLDRGALLTTGSSVTERIKPVGEVSVQAAELRPEPVASAAAAPAPGRDGQQVYQASCAVCHGAGIAGAPKVADKGQWAKRIAKGVDTLYASALNGIQGSGGAMPPKGGNAALSDAEVRAAVDFMVRQAK